MKTLFYFNLGAYLFVIILYISEPIYGALTQIPLGFIQIIMAINLSVDLSKYSKSTQNLYNAYWIIIVTWLVLYLIIANSITLKNTHQTFLFIIPMCIGFYFVMVTYFIQKKIKA